MMRVLRPPLFGCSKHRSESYDPECYAFVPSKRVSPLALLSYTAMKLQQRVGPKDTKQLKRQ